MATNRSYQRWGKSRRYRFLKAAVEEELQDIYSASNVDEESPPKKAMYQVNAVSDSLQLSSVSSDVSEEEIPPQNIAPVLPPNPSSEDNEEDNCSDADSLEELHLWETDDESNDEVYEDDFDSESVVMLNEDNLPLALRDSLKLFALECNLPHTSLRRLLYHLKPFHPELPKDPRTIMKGPTKVAVEPMGPGLYYNFGIANQLASYLRNFETIPNSLTLDFNADGLQIFRSTSYDFWPILCRAREMSSIAPFICTVYGGTGKPKTDDYFKDLIPELQELRENGLNVGCQKITIKIGNFICDRPARAYIKEIKGHAGYYGCDRCVTRGDYVGRVVFPQTDAELRTDDNFFNDENHLIGHTSLSRLDIGMISNFPLDVMHLVYLGVTRKLLRTWTNGKRGSRISSLARKLVNDDLVELSKMWPVEFSRKPRSLAELDRWKATELRQFILYIGPIVLKKHLPKTDYKLFMLLHIACVILCRRDLYRKFNLEAHESLVAFVNQCIQKYGEKFITYNVHSLIHLAKDAADHGPVDSFSAFPFENALGSVKRLIRGKNKPLQQFIHRTLENTAITKCKTAKLARVIAPFVTSRHDRGPTAGKVGTQYSRINWNGVILSTKPGDNVAILKTNKIVVIVNFISSNDLLFCVAKKYRSHDDFYKTPLKSSQLGICKVEKLSNHVKVYPLSAIAKKGVMILQGNGSVVFPLQTESC